ncbi:putative heat shock protein HtpX [Halobacteriovorax sp. BALOs_7]|uniref:protease HtpX n=1 Tax=Halobacteriovorax sp. BALOs_7 TaxID=2109558 RepID=UPI000EA2038D|nr:protease HtpX [Halobacteriovorax sp. BALOs_7]AYF44588.1 putative heat shock protein HtpX [Halobacteriovorax sp. BALOs_7]
MLRVGLFILTNILVVATVGIILSLLGIPMHMNQGGYSFEMLIIFCSVWGFAGSFISLAMSKFMAKRMYPMTEISENDPNYGWVAQSVSNYAKLSGIKKPEVYIYNSNEVNAFATGPSRNNSMVAVSAGLIHTMSRDEAEGVIGHEIAHIANGDMVTMALVQGVVNAFVMILSRLAAMAISNAMRSEDDEGPGLGYFAQTMLVVVLDIVFGLLAMPITMWFSRFREYRADAGSARLAGREKMIAALRKLQQSTKMVDNSNPNMSAFKISSGTTMAEIFSSHPTLEKRIHALQSRSNI